MKLIKPPKLKLGDTIGLISPSAPLAGLVPHRTKRAIKMLNNMGFKVKIGKNALNITGYTAGSPKERAEDINLFFKDKEVKAIICFIGGNHSNQVLKYLDFNLIKKNPKIFVGYSDATVLHFAFYTQANLITFYGPAALTQFAENPRILPYTEEYFKKALMEDKPIGVIKPSSCWTYEILDWFKKEDLRRPRKMKKNKGWQWLKQGKVEGPILGGCITSMMHLRGTKYWPDFTNKILFWEIPESDNDFTRGERIENIDSYLTDLELSGIFKKVKGMIIGRFFGYSDKEKKEAIRLVKIRTTGYKFPILANVDIGHTDPILTIPLGVKAVIDCSKNLFEIVEKGTH
ncbi:MAG: LD-carboxypeptidase [Candidatus Parcubacteria bacterium]|nr:MAG: LD-carboxypeptidase [Candidatus Parcubacteria bacterium]